jgi:hypothetical protein
VYGEVNGAEALLKYKVVNTGCCKLLIHPIFGSAVYPATLFTTAPPTAVAEAVKALFKVKSSSSDISLIPQPTTHSNWVIQNKLALGSYPDPAVGFIDQLLSQGFNTFVCLQTEEELKSFRPYRHLLPDTAKYIHFGVVDNDATASDEELVEFVDQLSVLLDSAEGEVKMYLHCWGGHGRSGSVAVLLLVKREGLTLEEALLKANEQHSLRKHNPLARIPQSEAQMSQLERIYSKMSI